MFYKHQLVSQAATNIKKDFIKEIICEFYLNYHVKIYAEISANSVNCQHLFQNNNDVGSM